tara:strand:+ start:363 stop:464 length:102 start_codon:yes stop_codon:yes gene_type:complete
MFIYIPFIIIASKDKEDPTMQRFLLKEKTRRQE